MAGEDAYFSQAPGPITGFKGSINVRCGTLLFVPQWQKISSSESYIQVKRDKLTDPRQSYI